MYRENHIFRKREREAGRGEIWTEKELCYYVIVTVHCTLYSVFDLYTTHNIYIYYIYYSYEYHVIPFYWPI